jgi:hypothetical protein
LEVLETVLVRRLEAVGDGSGAHGTHGGGHHGHFVQERFYLHFIIIIIHNKLKSAIPTRRGRPAPLPTASQQAPDLPRNHLLRAIRSRFHTRQPHDGQVHFHIRLHPAPLVTLRIQTAGFRGKSRASYSELIFVAPVAELPFRAFLALKDPCKECSFRLQF